MPDCIICYETGATSFHPSTRHTDCVCRYDIHSSCYKKWLRSNTDLAFHCVICRKTLTKDETITNTHNWEPTLRYALAIFFIVINFYKQVIALLLFGFTVIYVKKLIIVLDRRQREQAARV